jgi:hypothetical protein
VRIRGARSRVSGGSTRRRRVFAHEDAAARPLVHFHSAPDRARVAAEGARDALPTWPAGPAADLLWFAFERSRRCGMRPPSRASSCTGVSWSASPRRSPSAKGRWRW